MKVYFVKKEGGNLFGGDHFLSGAENYLLHKAMVYHDQQRIEAGGKEKVSDEVTGDLLEGARCVGPNRSEQWNGGVYIHLVLLAQGTTVDVFPYELCEAWLPEFSSNELTGLKITGVSGSLVVMAVGEDGVIERILQRNIDMTFVGQNMVIKLPVRETGLEGSGDVL